MMRRTGNLIVVSAPSGSGKTSIVQHIMADSAQLVFSISYTTRPPRQGETDGRDYFFVNPETFRNMIAEEEFYEWAEVYGRHYGTSRSFVQQRLAAGFDVLLDIDVQGARQVKTLNPAAVLVFIMPPSYAVLAQRLHSRGLDNEADIRRRLGIAREEVSHFVHYDYVVVNDRLEEAVAEVRTIVQAARFRVANNMARIQSIVETFREECHA